MDRRWTGPSSPLAPRSGPALARADIGNRRHGLITDTMSKTPSVILSDALTTFNRAATLAFSTAQDQARKDVAQATADAREARRERDEAVSALHAHRLEEQAWKQEAGEWKAAANQAELAVHHHLETIAQLRQEAAQWKNQCLRLEETSRQEAISWKEQFLRVEQERSKLAQRAEELVAERLASGGHAQTTVTPYTPLQRYSAVGDLSASTCVQRASALDSMSPSRQERRLPKTLSSMSKTIPSANRSRPGHTLQLPTPSSENQRGARPRVTQDTSSLVSQRGSTSNSTRQIVIRRVHAVMEVPVKEESLDRDVGMDTLSATVATSAASTSTLATKSALGSTSKTAPPVADIGHATPRVKRKAPSKRTYVEVDGESEQDGVGHDSKHSDTEEYQPVSDGDDELLMGIETSRKEVHGIKRVAKPVSLQQTSRTPKKRKAPVPTASKKSRPSVSLKP